MSRIAKLLLTSEAIFSFGSGLFLPIFAIFSQQVGGDIVDAGIAAGIFVLVTSSLEIPIGKLLATKPEKWFLVADYFLEACVFIGYIFVTNKYELFILQILLGVANAMGDPAWEALYDKTIALKRPGVFWANMHLITGWATGLGIILGSMLIHSYGFKLLFFVGAIHSLIAGGIILIKLKSQE